MDECVDKCAVMGAGMCAYMVVVGGGEAYEVPGSASPLFILP